MISNRLVSARGFGSFYCLCKNWVEGVARGMASNIFPFPFFSPFVFSFLLLCSMYVALRTGFHPSHLAWWKGGRPILHPRCICTYHSNSLLRLPSSEVDIISLRQPRAPFGPLFFFHSPGLSSPERHHRKIMSRRTRSRSLMIILSVHKYICLALHRPIRQTEGKHMLQFDASQACSPSLKIGIV